VVSFEDVDLVTLYHRLPTEALAQAGLSFCYGRIISQKGTENKAKKSRLMAIKMPVPGG
jgi:hypothetical protein